ncbi:MAG: iron ABC transporter substrate-binding protein [Methanobacteriaceae archaeon]|jgi:iron complex transport system substrate-binding protein|nr:iron ABC transporter substrate-binding protein [Methanobacteriaceae archaeon]OPY20885.1 MAG: corrinoid ABC transporter substrate-binding protein [Methanobacterium sp. PtaU1.Bin097]
MDRKLMVGIIVIFVLIGGASIYYLSGNITNSTKGSTVSVTDVAGRTVQVPAQVNRVIGTGCSCREIVYLNASDKIVGIEQSESNSTGGSGKLMAYMVARPELMSLPVVTSGTTINYEKIAELHPDVVFANSAEEADTIQSKTGIPTVVVYIYAVGTPEQMNKYKQSLRVMGKVLNKEERAEELIGYIDSYEQDLKNRTKNMSSNKTVYMGGQAYGAIHGITATNAFYPPFEMVNATNVAANINTSDASKGFQVEKEQLITWNPDVIFIEETGLKTVINDTSKNPEYKEIKAIQDGNVYGLLPYCTYAYNKEEMIADAYYVGKVLYPEQFTDVDPEKKADEIFVKFLGKAIYNDLKAQYGGFKKLDL